MIPRIRVFYFYQIIIISYLIKKFPTFQSTDGSLPLYSYIRTINQEIHIYKYIQSHIVILHHHISVTLVSVIRMSYKKNTISIQITVGMYVKILNITFNILSDLKNYVFTLLL